ncbi:MAG TPA: hypothetical protein VML55_05250 [Planctomycetaceae bacterium]|nr:hypothetical protein [Planctomycetaceae bacterium]
MSRSIPRRTLGRTWAGFALMTLAFCPRALPAQDEPQAPVADAAPVPEIPDEPRTVDPATLVPEKLAAVASVDFAESSLREIAQWIEEHQSVPVLFDSRALAEAGIPLGEPVTDRLRDEPGYLLLNRLHALGLAWFVEDDVVHITTSKVADERMRTEPYSVGDLLDAGYESDDLIESILGATEGPWEDVDGTGGSAEWLGDVLFVRHNDSLQRQVAGLLAALRKHGAQTFTFDPPQHLVLRQTLDETVSVKFVDTPLAVAVRELAMQTGIDIRIDGPALRQSRIRDREPVSLTLSDRKLSTVLHVLLADLNLTWILRDGVLWITTADRADEHRKTVVYDVRDLCRNQDEADELASAIQKQTAGPWVDVHGDGGAIVFARTGTMVVRQTERVLREVRELLTRYREALLASKPRPRDAVDPQEVVTRYYRMHERIADGLAQALPLLVLPDTWKEEFRPDAAGTILKVSSEPQLLDAQGRTLRSLADVKSPSEAFAVPRAVLIIRQTRAAHDEVARIIRRVEQGDPDELAGAEGGFGGGGFGGGFFSVPPASSGRR